MTENVELIKLNILFRLLSRKNQETIIKKTEELAAQQGKKDALPAIAGGKAARI
jgi:hypothetical protein